MHHSGGVQRMNSDSSNSGGNSQLPADIELQMLLCEELLEPVPYLVPLNALGSGSFGVVIKANDTRTNPPTEVALKMMPRGGFVRSYKTYLKREIVHTASLRHPLIIPLREVFLTPTHLGISMEFCAGGDLHCYLGARPGCCVAEDEARWLFQQLIVGLQYCHHRGVANRDLKLENLLLDTADEARPLLKICDFGYSKHEMNSSAKTGVGTTAYMAPEVLLGSLSYNAKAADMWSAGVVLFALLVGRLPFDPTSLTFARTVVEASYTIPQEAKVSDAAKDVLARLLRPEPERRATADELLQHPWILKDLPAGSLELNAELLKRHHDRAAEEQVVTMQVDALVESAETLGAPGEPVVSVPL